MSCFLRRTILIPALELGNHLSSHHRLFRHLVPHPRQHCRFLSASQATFPPNKFQNLSTRETILPKRTKHQQQRKNSTPRRLYRTRMQTQALYFPISLATFSGKKSPLYRAWIDSNPLYVCV